MDRHSIKTVGVIGAGVIGSSWTLYFLSKGLRVIVVDPAPGARGRLEEYLQQGWPKMQQAGLHAEASVTNYRFVGDIFECLDEIDLVQETGPENVDFKRRLFAKLDAEAPRDVLLLSSSSGIPSSQFCVDCVNNPKRVLIGHPFNPPHMVPLVEVVPHPGTGEQYITRTLEFYRSIGKEPILIKRETPGFIANRLQMALCSEAYSLVARGIVSAADIDTCVTSALGLRWAVTGPFTTNILAGGGNFRHLLEHIGLAARVWGEDMRTHAIDLTPDNISTLDAQVQDSIGSVDVRAIEEYRDEILSKLIAMKSKNFQQSEGRRIA